MFKTDPMRDLSGLQDKMNKLFGEAVKRIKDFAEPEESKSYRLAVDIFELPTAFVLMAEIPGVPKDKVVVEVQGGNLVIRGDRPPAFESSMGTLFHSERYYGSFERTFNMPVSAEPDQIQAKIRDGVLTVTIPKPQEDVTRIKVDVEE